MPAAPSPVVVPVVRPSAESTGIPAVYPATPIITDIVTVDPCTVQATVQPTACVVEVVTHPLAVDFITPAGIPADPASEAEIPASLLVAGIPVTPPVEPQQTPLFVRKRAGQKWKYQPAHPDNPGQKFRKMARGKRTVYELAR